MLSMTPEEQRNAFRAIVASATDRMKADARARLVAEYGEEAVARAEIELTEEGVI